MPHTPPPLTYTHWRMLRALDGNANAAHFLRTLHTAPTLHATAVDLLRRGLITPTGDLTDRARSTLSHRRHRRRFDDLRSRHSASVD